MNQPNILFILIDDMGWKDLSCYGSKFYETPNIDKLAKNGMIFTDAYAACPVCSPTRASILTGKYPATIGVTDWIGAHTKGKLIDAPYIDHLPLSEYSLANALKKGGYATWHIGKWHLGTKEYYPEKHGFDVNIGGCHWGCPKNGYFSPYHIENLTNGLDGEYLTDRLTNEAIHLIKNRDLHKPFFMHLSHYTVHTPLEAKESDIQYYKEKASKMKLDQIDPFVEGDFHPCEHKRHIRIKRRTIQSDPTYAAMIGNLDENIGRIMTCLDEQGLSENTLIVFTSDNGGLATSEGSPTCNKPLNEGKGWMYEGGIREPLIIHWPKVVPKGSICHEPVTSPDFYPTLLEAAELNLIPSQHVDGISIMPLLQKKNNFERGPIFWHYPHYGNQGGTPGSSVRHGQYKLIEFFEDHRLELYDLHNDLSETQDISGTQPQLTMALHKKLQAWRHSVEALIPQVNPDFNP